MALDRLLEGIWAKRPSHRLVDSMRTHAARSGVARREACDTLVAHVEAHRGDTCARLALAELNWKRGRPKTAYRMIEAGLKSTGDSVDRQDLYALGLALAAVDGDTARAQAKREAYTRALVTEAQIPPPAPDPKPLHPTRDPKRPPKKVEIKRKPRRKKRRNGMWTAVGVTVVGLLSCAAVGSFAYDSVADYSMSVYDSFFGDEQQEEAPQEVVGPEPSTEILQEALLYHPLQEELRDTIVAYYKKVTKEGKKSKKVNRQKEKWAIYSEVLTPEGGVLIDLCLDGDTVGVAADCGEMRVASINKLPLFVAVEDQKAQGNLEDDPRLNRTIRDMIVKSDNPAFDTLLSAVGGVDAAHGVLADLGYEDITLEVIDHPRTKGRTLGNTGVVTEYAEMLHSIYRDEATGAKYMRRVLELEGGRKHPDRVYDKTCIPGRKESLRVDNNGGYVLYVGDKTGYIYGANGDAAVIDARFVKPNKEHVEVKYSLVMVINSTDEVEMQRPPTKRKGSDPKWGSATSETIRSVSEGIFWTLQEHYSTQEYKCKTHNGKHL